MMQLIPGHTYQVTQSFTDYDNQLHLIGERWLFLSKSFVPYDDGLVWNLQPPEGPIRRVRMWWDARGQQHIIEHLENYLQLVP